MLDLHIAPNQTGLYVLWVDSFTAYLLQHIFSWSLPEDILKRSHQFYYRDIYLHVKIFTGFVKTKMNADS